MLPYMSSVTTHTYTASYITMYMLMCAYHTNGMLYGTVGVTITQIH